jgi:hypothetical protein
MILKISYVPEYGKVTINLIQIFFEPSCVEKLVKNRDRDNKVSWIAFWVSISD